MNIYKTTNIINYKIYIGQEQNFNPNYYGSGIKIKRAVKKYGKQNFNKEIICFCDTKEELDVKEKQLIQEYHS